MVFVFVLLTVAVFIAVDYFLRREERAIKKAEKKKKSPIFLSPEKALLPIRKRGTPLPSQPLLGSKGRGKRLLHRL
ncbi:MAG TPA: hypothetical protein EYP36_10910 [Calditrichaeota bacterium]|nr:hypothetical protein [Calditrichota bacterium]